MVFGLNKITPNPIDGVSVPDHVGMLGLVACPGVRVMANSVGNKRHLQADLQAIVEWGTNGLVTLFEDHEFTINQVEDLHARLNEAGIWTMHLPIIDMQIPDQTFEDEWAVQGERIRHALRLGERVVLHCFAGLGRTGMIAARLLVEMGMEHDQAVQAVRKGNKRRIQTQDQLDFVYTCYPLD